SSFRPRSKRRPRLLPLPGRRRAPPPHRTPRRTRLRMRPRIQPRPPRRRRRKPPHSQSPPLRRSPDMSISIDVASLPAPAQKILDPSAPAPLRQMAAKGIAPGLKPVDALAVVALLSESPDAALAATAQATLDKLPAPLLNGALGGQ